MPWSCQKRGNQWVRVKKGGEVISHHSSLAKCKAAIRAASAGEYGKMKNEFSVEGVIGKDSTCEDLISALEEADKSEPFNVRINSSGGNFIEGMNMFNTLMAYEGEVHTYNEGIAGSAAGVLLLAGSKIYSKANALTMLHAPRMGKPIKGTTEEIKNILAALEATKAQMAETIKARTGKSAESVGKILAKDTWYTAKKAKAEGIIDEVIEIQQRKIDLVAIDDLPQEIVAEVESFNKEIESMTIKDLCASFEIDLQDVPEEEIEGKLTDFVEGLQAKAANLEKELEETKAKIPAPKEKKYKLPKSFTEMIAKSRNKEVDGLVEDGKITGAVAKDIKKSFCETDNIEAALNDEGEVVDSFDSVVAALDKNEAVISFKGKSGTQQLPDSGKGTNPLLAEVERRNKGV